MYIYICVYIYIYIQAHCGVKDVDTVPLLRREQDLLRQGWEAFSEFSSSNVPWLRQLHKLIPAESVQQMYLGTSHLPKVPSSLQDMYPLLSIAGCCTCSICIQARKMLQVAWVCFFSFFWMLFCQTLGIQVVVKFLEVSIHVFETQTQSRPETPPKSGFCTKTKGFDLKPSCCTPFWY